MFSELQYSHHFSLLAVQGNVVPHGQEEYCITAFYCIL